jgi:hypothetical protein
LPCCVFGGMRVHSLSCALVCHHGRTHTTHKHRSSSTPWPKIGYSPARPMDWSACSTQRSPTKTTPSFQVRFS